MDPRRAPAPRPPGAQPGRVVVFSYDFPPGGGGIARLSGAIAEHLQLAGWNVDALTVTQPELHSLKYPPTAVQRVPIRRPWRDLAAIWRLLCLPRQTIVIAANWRPEGVLTRLLRHRLVLLAHGNEIMPHGKGTKRSKAVSRRNTLRAAALVICNSRFTERLVLAVAPTARTTVIHPRVDLERFHPASNRGAVRARLGLPDNRFLLLTVARLDRHKGHDTVLHALALLSASQRAGITYVIAGSGPEHSRLLALTRELGLEDTVEWRGFVDDATLPDLYAAADLVVLCSREDRATRAVEGFGMALMEAQSAGTPVIGSNSGGIPDAVQHGEGGWLVDVDDPSALAQQLGRCLAHPEDLREQAHLARRRAVGAGGWDAYMAQLEPALEALL